MAVTMKLYLAIFVVAGATLMFGGNSGMAEPAQTAASTGFAPLDQWRSAVLAGDAVALKAFYSTDPAAQVEVKRVTSGADADVNFWLALKARSMKMEIVRLKERPGGESVIFKRS